MQKIQLSLYGKIVSLILILIVPVAGLYTYSSQVSTGVVTEELKRSNVNQLTFMLDQLESRVEQMMYFSMTLLQDPHVRRFKGIAIMDSPYDLVDTKIAIMDKLALQNLHENWESHFSVFTRNNDEVVSTMLSKYSADYLDQAKPGAWEYRQDTHLSRETHSFYWYTHDAYQSQDLIEGANVVIEARVRDSNIQRMLDEFKGIGRSDPFFYHSEKELILNSTANQSVVRQLIGQLKDLPPGYKGTRAMTIGEEQFEVSVVHSKILGWYLIDYVPVRDVLQPITLSKQLFYGSLALLLLLTFTLAFLLYRTVQVPIRKLINSLQSIKIGNYSVRLQPQSGYEFNYVFQKFNEMSQQIEELIDHVFKQQLRVREASLKQLQSQINPHFLYNSLGFIINMAEMKNEQAVVTMAHNLSDFYRYTTRLEKPTASLKEEVTLVMNYLEIQKLRIDRLHYAVDVEESMKGIEIPRLLVQPLVENAIIHGISKSQLASEIRVIGREEADYFRISIEDDGKGMTDEALCQLQSKLSGGMGEEMGFGLWNVHQRIQHHFGKGAGLQLEHSPLGGLKASIIWFKDSSLTEE